MTVINNNTLHIVLIFYLQNTLQQVNRCGKANGGRHWFTNDHESYVSEVIDEIFIPQFGQNAQLKIYSYGKIGILLFWPRMRYTLLQFLLSLQLEIAGEIIQFGLPTRAQRNED